MPADGLDPSTRLGKQTEDPSPRLHCCYAELCKLENLQRAYAQLKKDCQDQGLDTRAWEAVESNGVQTFLRRLSADLLSRTYHPRRPPVYGPPRDRRQVRTALLSATRWFRPPSYSFWDLFFPRPCRASRHRTRRSSGSPELSKKASAASMR